MEKEFVGVDIEVVAVSKTEEGFVVKRFIF